MNTRTMMVSALTLSLLAGGSTLAHAGQKAGCDRADRAGQRVEHLTRQLALDKAQQAAVKALFAARTERNAAHPRTRMRGLEALDPNASDYRQQVQRHIGEMQRQLAEWVQARADFKASLFAILTPEQEQKWAALHDRRGQSEQPRKGHRHEGPRDHW
ncbi:Spy/CpxP family protein refolding chaperone [Marinobacterium weihaiense]|uniref:Spy/CpxP family protein refolding chaperone n=1 Tax=Marinobacterium weihaiense TaxID=2851016 RepID=A0ABS6MA95_9GAMM|nr:Spy/CpxP family protein refolding chaperone [Marinobacterium weihaiense]MBV0933211.1 Spy/CpxP family protein refolding chaperone [Marinobacterium weihaiense]